MSQSGLSQKDDFAKYTKARQLALAAQRAFRMANARREQPTSKREQLSIEAMKNLQDRFHIFFRLTC